jgi:RNA polymerase sigma factor (sigma-70 family)
MSIADEYTYLVQSLSIQNGWSLSQEVCLNYATRVWQSAIVDRRLQEDFVRHYHADHELVEALGHPTHPEHRMYYEHVEQRCRRIIRKHHHYWTRDRALSEDDVCQMCMEKVILKIHTFQYRSSFPTWLTALIINEALQLHRRQHTQSRASVSESLDDHAGLASPQEQVHDEVLAHMRRLEFEQVLAAQKDQRILLVFHLYVDNDLTLEHIGRHLKLSVGRTHALLTTARTLLREYLENQ